jgi:hypothetical protein
MTKTAKAAMALSVVAGLGMAAAPLAAYADTSTNIPVNVNVPEAIEIGDGDTTADISPSALNFNFDPSAGDCTIGTTCVKGITINATSTSPTGFNVTLATIGSTNNLANTTSTSAPSIAATAGGAALSANTWGYRLASSAPWAAVPVNGSAATLINNVTDLSAGASFVETVSVGVNVDATLPMGTYANTLVFTAESNS